MTSVIEVRSVSKSFRQQHRATKVLEDITFSIHEHEFVSLIGPSGCGKSTLIRIMIGLLKPDSGEVYYRGEKIFEPNPNMAMVFQSFALFPWMTVLENVELGLEAWGIPKGERRKKALAVLHEVGLEGFEEAYPRELSGGMRQRVGLARALAIDPDVLFMDEPFSNLDPLTAQTLREELLRLWEDRSVSPEVVVMVTHSVEEAVYMSDRVIVLSHRPGRILSNLTIDLPRPRERRSESFFKLLDEITTMIA